MTDIEVPTEDLVSREWSQCTGNIVQIYELESGVFLEVKNEGQNFFDAKNASTLPCLIKTYWSENKLSKIL